MMKRIAIVALCLTFAAPLASAKRTSIQEAPPIRNMDELRSGRHQLAPLLGFTMNDAYQRSLSAGLTYRYYFNNWLGVGLDFNAHYLNIETSLTEQIESELSEVGKTRKPSTSSLGILTGLGITLVPIHGKMMLLGHFPVSYDVHFVAGGGLATTKGHERIEDTTTFYAMAGLGARFFLSQWIAIETEVRDYIIEMPLVAPADFTAAGSTFEQNFMVTFGVSLFFPPELEKEL